MLQSNDRTNERATRGLMLPNIEESDLLLVCVRERKGYSVTTCCIVRCRGCCAVRLDDALNSPSPKDCSR